jgi:pyruvate/2-oxoglutarate dehydrogenase complex dihydrolipoamide acyltransferase (E2) component
MSDIIAARAGRVLAQKQGVDLEALARALGRQTLTREDVLQTNTPAAAKAQPSYWDMALSGKFKYRDCYVGRTPAAAEVLVKCNANSTFV